MYTYKTMLVDAINPKRIDNDSAWDVTVDGKIFEKNVTSKMIFSKMGVAHDLGIISDFDFMYGSCSGVRQWTVEAYVKVSLNKK